MLLIARVCKLRYLRVESTRVRAGAFRRIVLEVCVSVFLENRLIVLSLTRSTLALPSSLSVSLGLSVHAKFHHKREHKKVRRYCKDS